MINKVIIGLLLVIVVALVYRIFDLGVSATYAEESIRESYARIDVIKKYHRLDCNKISSVIDEGHNLVEKDGLIYIDTVEFKCVQSTDGNILVAQ